MASTHKLSDFIQIKRQFLRSVNLEKDCQGGMQAGDYIVTPTARQILGRIVEGLGEGSTNRAWTITGPYGVGKSAFGVFLTRLLCNTAGTANARKQLDNTDRSLARSFAERLGKGKGLLPVIVTGRRVQASLCLAEGVLSAIKGAQGSAAKHLSSECLVILHELQKGQHVDSRRIVNLITELSNVSHSAGYTGLLFMVDELGKIFEYAARVPQKADVFVFQELAEHASRSGNFPILFLGFLHQSFEEYGQHLDSLTRKEWAKIHGRFEDVVFLEPPDQVIRMIAEAIKWVGSPLPADIVKQIRSTAEAAADGGGCPIGMRKSEFEELSIKTYPLHPLTLAALPYIFRRFAQNERSLFSYLSSLEPSGFQDFLRRTHIDGSKTTFLRLSHLFDYFTLNFGSGLFRQPQARRWLEAADVLDRKDNFTQEHGELIKAIGVLGALGEFSNLSATEGLLSAAVCDAGKLSASARDGLKFLQEQSILTYRKFNKTFRIWEGSDVDIDERVAEGERQLRGRISLAASIKQYLPPRPIVARRHNFVTGALRYFTVEYVDDPVKVTEACVVPEGASGQVVVCISSSPANLQTFKKQAQENSLREIVYAIPQQIGEIQYAVAELAALRWAWENTPELRDDRVARREVSLRIVEAEQFLRHSLGALLDPREEPIGSECLWYWEGEILPLKSRTGVAQELSVICDKIYSKSPWVRNELIARKVLSNPASAARRALVERMITAPNLPTLGIEGYPPERSMYESLLHATGIHKEISKGKWGFFAPPKDKHGLSLVWDRLAQIVFESDGKPQAADAVFKQLGEAPFGIMDGISPVLLCAFMMRHSDEITLYREGTFIPEPSTADFEVLMRRPELFEIAGLRVAGFRADVLRRLAKSLGAQSATVPVVKALFKMVKTLPELAWRTKRLSERTIKVREAFEKAKSPDKFLYIDLPIAVGLPPFPEKESQKAEIDDFFDNVNKALKEWAEITPSTRTDARAKLLTACGFAPTDSGWQTMREAATKLEPKENDPILLQFMRRIVQASCDDVGIDSVLGLVVNRPLENWTDTETERFPDLAKGLGEPIMRAMRRHGITQADQNAAVNGLTSSQKERAKSLARSLKKQIDSDSISESPEIVRAALLMLAENLCEQVESKK